jgi:hypothetical protein
MMYYHFLQKKSMDHNNKFSIYFFDLGRNDIIKLEYWDDPVETTLDSQVVIDRPDFFEELKNYTTDEYAKIRGIPDSHVLQQAMKFLWSRGFMRRK